MKAQVREVGAHLFVKAFVQTERTQPKRDIRPITSAKYFDQRVSAVFDRAKLMVLIDHLADFIDPRMFLVVRQYARASSIDSGR